METLEWEEPSDSQVDAAANALAIRNGLRWSLLSESGRDWILADARAALRAARKVAPKGAVAALGAIVNASNPQGMPSDEQVDEARQAFEGFRSDTIPPTSQRWYREQMRAALSAAAGA